MKRTMKQGFVSRVAIVLAALGAASLGPAACSDAPPAPQPEVTGTQQAAVKLSIAFAPSSDEGSQKASPDGEEPVYQLMSASSADVAGIYVTVSDGTQFYAVDFPLEHQINGTWSGEFPFLPYNVPLTFEAAARDASNLEIFEGASVKTFDGTDQQVSITLAATDDGDTYELPRCEQIAVPEFFVEGETNSISFYLRGQTNETLQYAITPAANGGSFDVLSGQITLVGTSATLFAQYTAPAVSAPQTYTHTIKITNSNGNAISTTFSTNVVPEEDIPGGEVEMNVSFNPSILNVGGHRVDGSDQVTWTAAVSDDEGLAGLTYQWGFTPDDPSLAFAPLAGQDETNPATFGGYTLETEGELTLSVTDEDGGITTLHYNILSNLFPESVDYDPNGLAEVRAGGEHTCARYHSGVVRCWGRNNVGQLGLGNTFNIGDDELPSSVVSSATITGEAKQIVAGNAHTCALLKTGLVYCWGANASGQLGLHHVNPMGDGELVYQGGYVQLAGTAKRLAAGGDHTCAIMGTGNAICWGSNSSGQLGLGHTDPVGDNEYPYEGGNVQIMPAGQSLTVKDLALGSRHTCALLSDETVKCWGRNNEGQLGYANSSSNPSIGGNELPSSVGAVNVGGPVQKVVAGGDTTCALLKTGVVRCWGMNDRGQLGNGTANTWNNNYNIGDNELPTAGGNIVNFNNANLQVVDIAAGSKHVCAVVGGGGVRCWGAGAHGKLGYGNQTDQHTPGGAVNMNSITASRVTAGADHSCVFLANGAARCWGLGTYGRLGYSSAESVGDNELPSSAADIRNISIAP